MSEYTTQYSRISHHTVALSATTLFTGSTFTVPGSELIDDTWSIYDLALSEIGVDEFRDKAYIRIGSNIKELNLGTGTTTPTLTQVLTAGNITSGKDIEVTLGDIIKGQTQGVIEFDLGSRFLLAYDTSYISFINIESNGIGLEADKINIETLAESDFTFNAYAFKTLNIGDWDMDATATVQVAHGLSATEWKTIKNIDAIIRNDGDGIYYPIVGGGVQGWIVGVSEPTDCWIWNFEATDIYLARKTGGTFDSTQFNATSYNRGFIRFQYIPD